MDRALDGLSIGRHELLASLRALVEQCVIDGRGRVVRLHGEAGIGKTTVATEVAAHARGSGCGVWKAQAHELGRSSPFGLFTSSGWGDGPEMFRVDSLVDPIVDPMSTTTTGRAGRSPYSPHTARFALAESIVESVESRCTGPTMMVFEDLHWADEASLEALDLIGRSAVTHPLLVVITHRDGHRNEALERLVMELDGLGAESIAVPPLTDAEIDELVDRLCGGRAAAGLRARARGAAGNPFLVQELVDGLLAEGKLILRDDELHSETGEIPGRLRLALDRELSRLGEPVATVVRACSVHGTQIDVAVLAEQLGEPAVGLVGPVRAAIEAGLLIDDGGVLRFRHDLVRDAVYQQMPTAIGAAIHRELAGVLARRRASPALVASHLLLGDGDDDGTVELLREAAGRTAPLAPESAMAYLDRARDLVIGDLQTRLVIEQARLEAMTAAGRLNEAEGIAHWLLGAGPTVGASELHVRLAGLAMIAGEGRRALGWVERALEHADRSGDVRSRSRYLGVAAVISANEADYGGARNLALQAAELGRALGEPVGHSIASALLARMSVFAGDIDEGLRLGAHAVALADGDQTGEAHAWVPCLHYGMTALEIDQLTIAEEMVARGNELATTHRMSWALPLFGTLQAACHLRRGNVDRAAAEAETAVELAERMQSRQTITWSRSILALATLEMGSLAEARTWVERAEALDLTAPAGLGADHLALARAEVTSAEGDDRGALTGLCQDWDRFGAQGLGLHRALLAPELVRLATLDGNRARIQEAIAWLEASPICNHAPVVRAEAGWLRAVAEGDRAAALAALYRLRRSERRLRTARMLAAEPALVATDGRAGTSLREALSIFDDLGATRSANEGRSLLAGLGEPLPAVDGRWDRLTPTELDIVRLLAAGSTNAEIAQQRRSSRRTVESHLRRVYQKLGIEGRVKLTVTAAEYFRTSSRPE